ncbi:MAG: hypothetical protein J5482_04425 [Oscillospiraceae bacterium]|nr:hypothetical protein [Oscillospiraceae bacterium]
MKGKLPHDATPDVHAFFGDPDNCFDVINKFGTYNIQPTAEADNLFPLIGHGLPRRWRDMELDKYDLEQ